MKGPQLALAAVAVLAVLGVLWLLSESGAGDQEARPAPTNPAGRTTPTAAPAAERAEDLRAAVTAVPAAAGDSASVQKSATSAARSAWGRLVVVDGEERESREENGVLLIDCKGASGALEELRAPVQSGAWRLELSGAMLSEGTTLVFRHVLVGRRRMRVLAPTAGVRCADAHDLEVRARRPTRTLLRATDASTSLDLRNVELVRSEAGLHVQHPGLGFDERVIARGLVSPIELDDLRDVELGPRSRLFVGARGYAWQSLELDLEGGGERVAALAPGADLSLTVRGVDSSSSAVLRVRRVDTREPLLTLPLPRDDTLELLDLPAQPLSVSAEVGDWLASTPHVLARVDLDLTSVKRVNAELVLSVAPKPSTAPVRGALYASSEWALSAPTLLFRSRDGSAAGVEEQTVECSRTSSSREGFEAFAFHLEAAPIGSCELVLFTPNYSVSLEVPPAGLEGLEVVLPPPAEIEFELLDAQTGERAANTRLGWHSARPPGISSGGIEWSTLGGDGVHRVRAPAGEIKLMVLTNDYEPYDASLRVAPGDPRRTVRLERACTIEVRLRAGGTALALPRTWSATPAAVEGQGKVLSTRRSGKALTFVVSPPGAFELRPDPIPGYGTPAPQRVDVQRGSPVSVEFVYEVERP